MTVPYSPIVASARIFGAFWKALKIYRGSIYKIIWRELIFFVIVFLSVQLTIIYVLSEPQQLAFKRLKESYNTKRKTIPVYFVLGFFVFLVIARWRTIHLTIPSADTFSLLLNSAIRSDSERSRLMRRTIMRYVIASFVINIRTISLKMRNKFPTFQSIVELGILLENEGEILEKIENRTLLTTYVIPLVWANNIINRARKEGLIDNDCIIQDLLTELGEYRRKLGDLLSYDLVCFPLFYIQVVTITIYFYFFTTIIGYQVCCDDGITLFLEIPISLFSASFEFTFHLGWVKVAEVLINPFGEDDEDFEVDQMVDRNLKAAYIIVDYMRVKRPKHNLYDYPVFGGKLNELQPLYENLIESRTFMEDHLYCSLEEDVATRIEDKCFQVYENVPVSPARPRPLTSSQSISREYAEYVNTIYEMTPANKISVINQTKAIQLKETSFYENVPVVPLPLQIPTSFQNTPYKNVDHNVDIYENIVIDEVSSSKPYASNTLDENVTVAPAPVHLPNQLRTSSHEYVDHVNVIYKNMPTDEVSSLESYAGNNMDESNIYDTVPVTPAPVQLPNQLRTSSHEYVDHVNVIYKNMPTDDASSSESDAGNKLEESKLYENVPVASTSQQPQSQSETPLRVENINVVSKGTPTDSSVLDIDAKTLNETGIAPKQKKDSKKFSFPTFKFNWKK